MTLLQFKSTEELIREKQGLEDFAAAAMAEGIEPSEDVKEQILELRTELERRDALDRRAEGPEQWIGATVGGCRLQNLLHESKYAYVFKAESADGQTKVIRLAKSDISVQAPRTRRHSFAFKVTQNEAIPLPVSPHQVIKEQIEVLNSVEPCWPGSIENRGFEGERPFYTMPFHDGQTLRELIELGAIPLDIYRVQIFEKLIETLAKLEANKGKVNAHGNLKPEHVLTTRDGIHLLSPGYHVANQVLTTPEYYPNLDGDDKLAVGIMLFECVCRVHPFSDASSEGLERRLSPQFRKQLESRIEQGFIALSGMLRFKTPAEIKPALSTEEQEFLIKALKLEFTATGELAQGKGFSDWNEFKEGLKVLS